MVRLFYMDVFLECDDKKWEPVFVKKSHENKESRAGFDSIKSHPALGSVSEKRAPCPGALSTVKSPFMARASLREI